MESNEPTETELEILKHLWRAGDQSAREIQLVVGERLGWKASTTRTVVSRMEAKGLLERKDVHGLAVYAAKADKVRTLAGILRGVARKVLETDSALPASFFAGSAILDEAEAERLAKMISEAEDDQ